jgi:hypothetical protein
MSAIPAPCAVADAQTNSAVHGNLSDTAFAAPVNFNPTPQSNGGFFPRRCGNL